MYLSRKWDAFVEFILKGLLLVLNSRSFLERQTGEKNQKGSFLLSTPPSHARCGVPIGAPSPCDPKSKSEREVTTCRHSCQQLLGCSLVLPHSAATTASLLHPQLPYFLRDYGRQDSALVQSTNRVIWTRKTCAHGHTRSLCQCRALKPPAVSILEMLWGLGRRKARNWGTIGEATQAKKKGGEGPRVSL